MISQLLSFNILRKTKYPMKFGVVLVLAAAVAASTNVANSTPTGSASSQCSEICTRIYKPVCGSDDVTYSNDCVLAAAQCKSGGVITKVSDGPCSSKTPSVAGSEERNNTTGCPDACLDVYDPVTDENGVQYSNECYLRMDQCKGETGSSNNSSLATPSTSLESEQDSSSCENRACTMDYNPVCGSNGVTYSNSCMLGIANCKDSTITEVGKGKCA